MFVVIAIVVSGIIFLVWLAGALLKDALSMKVETFTERPADWPEDDEEEE